MVTSCCSILSSDGVDVVTSYCNLLSCLGADAAGSRLTERQSYKHSGHPVTTELLLNFLLLYPHVGMPKYCCWLLFTFLLFGFFEGEGTPPRSKISHTLSFIILTYKCLVLGCWLVSSQLLLP